jgi:hypothetical protein
MNSLAEEIKAKHGDWEFECFMFFLPDLMPEAREKIESMSLDEYEAFMKTEEFQNLPMKKKKSDKEVAAEFFSKLGK